MKTINYFFILALWLLAHSCYFIYNYFQNAQSISAKVKIGALGIVMLSTFIFFIFPELVGFWTVLFSVTEFLLISSTEKKEELFSASWIRWNLALYTVLIIFFGCGIEWIIAFSQGNSMDWLYK